MAATILLLLLAGCTLPRPHEDHASANVSVRGAQILINGQAQTLFGFRVGSAPLREDWTRALIAQLPEWRRHGINSFTVWLQGTSGGYVRLFGDSGEIDAQPGDVVSRAGYGLVEENVVVGRSSGAEIISRTRRIVEAADRHGMVVIVGIAYRSSWRKSDNVGFVERAMAAAAAPFRDYGNVILNVWNEINTQNVLETPQAVSRYVRAIRTAAPHRLVCAGSLRSEMNLELAEQVDLDLYCQDAGRNLADTIKAYEALRRFGKPIINVESYGGNGGGYIDDRSATLAAPAGYAVSFNAEGRWTRIFGAWEEEDYRDATARPLMGKRSYRELIRYVGEDTTRQTHLMVHVAGWFQGASRVQYGKQLGDPSSPGRWNNVYSIGHGAASGDPAAPGIRWLLEEVRQARR